MYDKMSDEEIIATITEMRDKQGMEFARIAEHLTSRGVTHRTDVYLRPSYVANLYLKGKRTDSLKEKQKEKLTRARPGMSPSPSNQRTLAMVILRDRGQTDEQKIQRLKEIYGLV